MFYRRTVRKREVQFYPTLEPIISHLKSPGANELKVSNLDTSFFTPKTVWSAPKEFDTIVWIGYKTFDYVIRRLNALSAG